MGKEITVSCSWFEEKLVWVMWSAYGILFLISAILWGIFQSDNVKKEETYFETAVFFTLGILFLLAFYYFKKKCDAVAATLLVILPVFVIIFNFIDLNSMMLSPLSYGWSFAIPELKKNN